VIDRRRLLVSLSALAVGTPTIHRAIVAIAAQKPDSPVTRDDLKQAQWIGEYDFTDDEQDSILQTVNTQLNRLAKLRETPIPELQSPAFHFSPHQTMEFAAPAVSNIAVSYAATPLPESDQQIAFLNVHQLAELIQGKQLTSRRLTEIYLARLKKYGPLLRCVISLLEESALSRADAMDAEIAAGKYRGVLHGIPWGAKDLIDVEGTKTSWGIPHYQDRDSETTATVARKLDEAGCVLVAKLSLGALAQGDQWFGGKTRNPWNPQTGSSGSSAGSASAVVAGLVGFALGSETLGSITSPSKVCGATGFRPTFGRVSRHGCMPLSWTMDKIGPICRSVNDCALVFNAIHGADKLDSSTANYPFQWPSPKITPLKNLKGIRVGFSGKLPVEKRKTLLALKEMGCELVPFKLPNSKALYAMTSIIDIEAASVFDQLLRDRHTDGWNSWPESLRAAQYISAVDYLRLQRCRAQLMDAMDKSMENIDVLVNVRDVFHTNFTGHPSIVLPAGYRDRKSGGKRPIPTTFTGHLHDDERLLGIAQAYQQTIQDSVRNPDLDPWLEQFEAGTLDPRPNDDKAKVGQAKDEQAKSATQNRK
jgi:Asp-tRNA(Asn)/Glu-tRNA(Gln) amidotransferase A subunit family amidase